MMPSEIQHVAMAVESIEERLPLYTQLLGFHLHSLEEVPLQGVRVAMLKASGGTTYLELLEPLGENSGLRKFLQQRGEGLHHICLLVDDLAGELQRLKAQGVRLIDETPRPGEGGTMVGFIHPGAFHGILIELKQRQQS